MDAAALRTVHALREREVRARNHFLLQGMRLKTELDEFRLPSRTISPGSGSRFRLGRQVAAAVLAIGVQASLSTGQGMAEQTPAPMQQAGGDQEKCCTLSGTVTDASGAAVANASITITSTATNRAIALKTDKAGQFTAKDLESGKYDVTAEANGFKTTVVKGVEVNAGKAARVDIRLEMGNWGGCCEYAAAPMKAIPQEDYVLKNKPFTYSVGEAQDGGTLSGLAKASVWRPKDVDTDLCGQSGCGERPKRSFVRNVAHHSAVTPAGAEAGDEGSSGLSFGGGQPACAWRRSDGCDAQG